jgi:D-aspartate ligase
MTRAGAPSKQLPPAVVVGVGLNGLGVTRSLHRHGIDCVGVGMPKRLPSYSTGTCRIVQCESWTEDGLVSALKSIAANASRKLPLIITKEEAVRWVSDHREELQDDFVIRLPHKETLELLLSKVRFDELATKEGWPVPKTYSVRSRVDLETQLADIPYPCILKPDAKHSSFFANAPVKAYYINNAVELIDRYEYVSQWEAAVVIQPWIEGGDDRIGFCLAYYNKACEPQGLFVGRKLRQYPVGCGNTAIAAPAPSAWVKPILDASKTIFSALNYQGIGSIEFKMQADGTPIIIEPTVGRTNLQNELAVLNGVDLPAIAYFDMIGKPIGHAPALAGPCKLVNGGAHWRAFKEQRDNKSTSLSAWLVERRGRKRYMLFRLNDPAPFFLMLYEKVVRLLRKIIR